MAAIASAAAAVAAGRFPPFSVSASAASAVIPSFGRGAPGNAGFLYGRRQAVVTGVASGRQVTVVRVATDKELVVEAAGEMPAGEPDYGVVSIHHVGILCGNLERSVAFYKDLLGLEVNLSRPNDKLPYRGTWLWVGDEMIHLMELPNPDPLTGRPEHGGRDRHTCIAIRDVTKLKERFDQAGISYTLSRSGRPAIFARDPDGNALEFTQVD